MNRKAISVGLYEANCTVLWDDPEKALVIDPGADADSLLAFLSSARLVPAALFLTHGHFDHISGVDDLLASHPVPVYLHAADEPLAFCAFNVSQPGYPGMARTSLLDLSLADGDALPGWPGSRILHTPGHSPGSWCLHFPVERLLVAGDTLFAGSIGRTDLPGGSYAEIEKSLARLATLPDDTFVVCGHGPSTTIGEEKAHNPYL